MDILNFISWIKGGRLVKTVDPKQSLLPIAVRDPKRDDGWLTNAMTVEDFTAQIKPYKVYTALLTQSYENAPTAVVLENTIGETTFVYDGVGGATINNINFNYTNTFVLINMSNDDQTSFRACSTSSFPGGIYITTDENNWTAKIEIRVYN